MAHTATHHDDHHHAETPIPDSTVDVRPVRLISLAALAVGAAVYLIGGFVGRPQDRFVCPLVGHLVRLRMRVLALGADDEDQEHQHQQHGQRNPTEEGMSKCCAHAQTVSVTGQAAPSPR